jgi:hypothetical protein
MRSGQVGNAVLIILEGLVKFETGSQNSEGRTMTLSPSEVTARFGARSMRGCYGALTSVYVGSGTLASTSARAILPQPQIAEMALLLYARSITISEATLRLEEWADIPIAYAIWEGAIRDQKC